MPRRSEGDAQRILPEARRALRRRKGFVAASVGPHIVSDAVTGATAIHVIVEKKLDKESLPKTRELPRAFGNVPVNVIEIAARTPALAGPGPVPFTAPVAGPATNVPSGISIIPSVQPNAGAGTLGMVVGRQGDAAVYFLTVAHLALADVDIIVASGPAAGDLIGRIPNNTAADLYRQEDLRLDCAVIRAAPGVTAHRGLRPLPGPYASGTAEEGDVVYRFDAAGNKVFGTVIGVELDVPIPVNGLNKTGAMLIQSAPGTGPFCRPGDSGSVVLRESSSGPATVVGLLYAEVFDLGTGIHIAGAACQFDEVKSELGLELIS